jgi:hypothetical protein
MGIGCTKYITINIYKISPHNSAVQKNCEKCRTVKVPSLLLILFLYYYYFRPIPSLKTTCIKLTHAEICLFASFKSRTAWEIFTKHGMNVMPLEVTSISYFLISYIRTTRPSFWHSCFVFRGSGFKSWLRDQLHWPYFDDFPQSLQQLNLN